ncbi:MAG: hypothetical protein GF330_03170 [Candidatus Eisenbacteria bacterium]|nr:hypothetical protein [Candidatus Eisenbacteria bacterium]
MLPETGEDAPRYETILEEFELVAPSGNTLYGMIRRPDPESHPGLCFAAVVLVPGGINPGRLLALGYEARLLAEAGMVVATFNAEGRGEEIPEDRISEGSEDCNGTRQQDGLAAIVRFVQSLDGVDADNIGIKTQSFGITMGAGCLARYPELGVRYLVDGEGPPNSFVTCQEPWAMDADSSNDKHETVHGILGHYSTTRDSSAANREFWSTREAERFIGDISARYLRLQAEWDHSQPPTHAAEADTFHLPPDWWQCKHAAVMVNAAVAGGVPWVRVNLAEHGNAVGATYGVDRHPVYLPGFLADDVWDVRAIIEMARTE